MSEETIEDSRDQLIAEAELGEEARNFLQSDLGKCLLGMAEQEIMFAQEELETVSPVETEKIRELQFRAKLGRSFKQWIYELLDKGESALGVLTNEQTE